MLPFDGRDGALPAGGLISLPMRTYLTATHSGGGHHRGATVSIRALGKLKPKVLYSFGGIVSDTYGGALYYGTTSAGRTAGDGTVFSFTPP